MPIRIYNSLTRKKDPLPDPHEQPEVKMYVCGPTVYDEPHIGHARSAYIFDVVRRYLIYKGYKVKFVRNVTDVDDKIIEKARNEYKGEDLNSAFKKVADKYLSAYHDALGSLGIAIGEPQVIEPKASEYIGKMVDFIKVLIEKGVAYQAGGDVYFDITKAKDYGKLSHQSLDKMEVGARVTPLENKKNPLDFVLWKSAKVDEPSWNSLWGKGRPGWHIECSVMSSDILGSEFDIHGGGLDLIFPHHENEIAQSEGAGNKFAKIWMHHGLLTINGQKMSKSLGNFVTVKSFLEKYRDADILKIFFLSAHYSQPVDYNDSKIEESKRARDRINEFLFNALEFNKEGYRISGGNFEEIDKIEIRFEESMDNDFHTPGAIASIFDLVSLGNKNIENKDFVASAVNMLGKLSSVLGMSLTKFTFNIDKEIQELISERKEARKKGDFSRADKIRQDLEKKGIVLKDTKDGKTIWRRKS